MLIQFLVLLLIAGVCGALGQAIGGYSHGGCLVSIALGFIGACWELGLRRPSQPSGTVGHPGGRNKFSVVWSIVGSALFRSADES